MRGRFTDQGGLFSYIAPDPRLRRDVPATSRMITTCLRGRPKPDKPLVS